jgi:alpha-tubulin suppressor-like RCC1 family protein
VVLDNGQVHYFGSSQIWSRYHYLKEQSGSFIIKGHKIQSIALGIEHGVMVTMRGVVFGLGRNNNHQLGVVDPSALLGHSILTPIKVFPAVTKFREVAKLLDGKELQWLGAH